MELSKARFVKLDYQILTMDISPSAKIIYAYLANGARGSPDSTVSVTIKKITSDLKISRDLAMDSIRSLEENNLVSVTRSNGKRSIYQVQKAVGNSDRYQSEIATAPVGNSDCTSRKYRPPYTLYKKNIKRDIKRDGDNTFSPPSPSYDERIFREKVAGEIKYIPRKED